MALAPLVVIVGPTASGKTAAGLKLAEQVGGEVVCADARTIYKGMDIGTAKPSVDDQRHIRHHMIDVISPDQRYNAAKFKAAAEQSIADIVSRGKIPVVVGGTGLYVDALVYDFAFRPPANELLRAELEGMSVDALQARIIATGLQLPHNARNTRHLIRVIEADGVKPVRKNTRPHALIYGLHVHQEVLWERIAHRLELMLRAGLEAEVSSLVRRYGWDAPGLQTIGYAEWHLYFEGAQTLARTTELIHIATRQYAKRQRTWFKRNPDIEWYEDPNTLAMRAVDTLNKKA